VRARDVWRSMACGWQVGGVGFGATDLLDTCRRDSPVLYRSVATLTRRTDQPLGAGGLESLEVLLRVVALVARNLLVGQRIRPFAKGGEDRFPDTDL
jgi:hypothetical protein